MLAWSSLVLLVVYGGWFVQLGRADYWHGRSFRLEGRDEPAAALAAALQARRLDPFLPLRTQRVAMLEARLAYRTNDSDLSQAAMSHYQAALQQEPILGLDSANLAGLLWQQGQASQALDWLQQTIAADDDLLYKINLGYFFEQQGLWPEAVRAYSRALRQAPAIAGSGFWLATPERVAHWPAIELAASEGAPPETAVALALAQGEFDKAESLLGTISGNDAFKHAALAEIYLQREQPQLAQPQLASPPVTAYDYLLLGRSQWQLGQATAETSLKTAAFLGDRRAYFYLGQLYEAGGDLTAAETAYRRGFSAHTTSENVPVTIYGRFGGSDLAPQLLRLGISPTQAAPWLALARLLEDQSRLAEAEQVYRLLLAEDPFLAKAQRGLAVLEDR